MNRWLSGWLGVLALNLVWVFLLPSRTGKTLALIGALVALAIVLRRVSPGELDDRAAEPFFSRDVHPLMLSLFMLPALAFWRTPRLVFWVLDGRSWLILAWIGLLVSIELTASFSRPGTTDSRNANRAVSPSVGLFILWTSVFWLTVVWDLGVVRRLDIDRTNSRLCQPSDPLTTIISIWESEPASEHLFLGWRTRHDFDTRTAYANHVHPYLFIMYGWIASIRVVTGSLLFVASNTVPFFYMFVLLASMTVLLARSGLLQHVRGAVAQLVLFFAIGSAITAWRFWSDLYTYNSDNPYPLVMAALVFVYACLIPPTRPLLATASATGFVALSPIHAPMLILAIVCLFAKPGASLREAIARNRQIVLLSVCAAVVGAVALVVPRMLIAWKGYQALGSTLLFRSGLDGDTRYFTSIIQAAWAPCAVLCCYARPASDLLLPAFLPLAIFGPFAFRDRSGSRLELGRMLLFLCTPYLVSVVFFPQSVSIHPYLYDHLLLVPVVVAGAAAMLAESVRRHLHGSLLLGFILVMSAVIMSNLLSLAQHLATIP